MQLSTTVALAIEDEIALICIDNPPVNAAGVDVRQGLAAAADWLAANPRIRAAALYAAGRTFVAGADIREFGKPPLDPWLPEVCNLLEDCPTPIACILHGTTLGGGLEIAMACHARLALPGARVGLPEVLLGILPGAGGTQRMPRLAGPTFSVEAITTGRHIPLDEALSAGLIDGPATGDTPEAAARAAAHAILDGTRATRRTGTLTVTPDPDALETARTRIRAKQPHLFSPLKCVDAIEAATLPLPEGLRTERALYEACQASPQRAGLIHAFFAERATAKVPEAAFPPKAIDTVGVIGAGTMGAGIATACLLAGLPVVLNDRSADALARGRATIAANLDGAVKRGKLASAEEALARLTQADTLDAMAHVDLVIEAAFEDMEVKTRLFRALDIRVKPGAILATNTSYLDINAIAAATTRPEAVLGLHFFSPAHVMKLLEIVVPDGTAPETAATGFALARRLRKIPVRSGVCDGFIGNRILRKTRAAAEHMMLDGAPFSRIDAAIEAAGWAMGPFRVSDLAGLDIARAQRKRRAATRPAEERQVTTPDSLCEQGFLGRKSGAGYYLPDGTANPAALAALDAERRAKGLTPRAFGDAEIVTRYLTAMILEATAIVEEGIALKPIDVDAVLLFGYGFPRHLGGPLHQADQIGADTLLNRIKTYAQDDAHFWRAPRLLQDMAATGTRFDSLDMPLSGPSPASSSG